MISSVNVSAKRDVVAAMMMTIESIFFSCIVRYLAKDD